jgi:phosphoribosylcarboxyaminoimidazole (NCAIR) mutase
MRAGVMSLQDAGASSHVENAALYAFMELNQFNENVISKTNGYKRYRTQELIKEQQETILYQAKL